MGSIQLNLKNWTNGYHSKKLLNSLAKCTRLERWIKIVYHRRGQNAKTWSIVFWVINYLQLKKTCTCTVAWLTFLNENLKSVFCQQILKCVILLGERASRAKDILISSELYMIYIIQVFVSQCVLFLRTRLSRNSS